MNFTLYDADRTLINILCIILVCICFDQRLSAVYGKRLRETVTADCNDTYFYFWNINHDFASLLYVIILIFC